MKYLKVLGKFLKGVLMTGASVVGVNVAVPEVAIDTGDAALIALVVGIVNAVINYLKNAKK